MTDILRPIVGIENRTAQEVFDIMCDRFRQSHSLPGDHAAIADKIIAAVKEDDDCRGRGKFEVMQILAALTPSALSVPVGDDLAKSLRTSQKTLDEIARQEQANIAGYLALRDFPIGSALSGDAGEGQSLRNVLWQARDTIVQHHQWHAAQTDPDPEHGFIPADEYADSQLYERTIAAIGAVDKLLETGPRDQEAALPSHQGAE